MTLIYQKKKKTVSLVPKNEKKNWNDLSLHAMFIIWRKMRDEMNWASGQFELGPSCVLYTRKQLRPRVGIGKLWHSPIGHPPIHHHPHTHATPINHPPPHRISITQYKYTRAAAKSKKTRGTVIEEDGKGKRSGGGCWSPSVGVASHRARPQALPQQDPRLHRQVRPDPRPRWCPSTRAQTPRRVRHPSAAPRRCRRSSRRRMNFETQQPSIVVHVSCLVAGAVFFLSRTVNLWCVLELYFAKTSNCCVFCSVCWNIGILGCDASLWQLVFGIWFLFFHFQFFSCCDSFSCLQPSNT